LGFSLWGVVNNHKVARASSHWATMRLLPKPCHKAKLPPVARALTIKGATHHWLLIASSAPPTHNTLVDVPGWSCPLARMRTSAATTVKIKVNILCAANSLAAAAPATAGVSKCINNTGTATKAKAVVPPHHNAANKMCKRLSTAAQLYT
jgi:hypothetical protein